MKKTPLFVFTTCLICTTIIYFSCSKNNVGNVNSDKIIQAFFESPTFLRHKSYIQSFGTIANSKG